MQHDLQHGSLITFPKEENLGNKRKPIRTKSTSLLCQLLACLLHLLSLLLPSHYVLLSYRGKRPIVYPAQGDPYNRGLETEILTVICLGRRNVTPITLYPARMPCHAVRSQQSGCVFPLPLKTYQLRLFHSSER